MHSKLCTLEREISDLTQNYILMPYNNSCDLTSQSRNKII